MRITKKLFELDEKLDCACAKFLSGEEIHQEVQEIYRILDELKDEEFPSFWHSYFFIEYSQQAMKIGSRLLKRWEKK